MHSILILDDDENVISALQRTLRRTEYDVDAFICPEQALKRCMTKIYECIISDYKMPAMDGVTFLTKAREAQPDAIRLMMSAQADYEVLQKAIVEANIYNFIPKPWENDGLIHIVTLAIEQQQIYWKNKHLAKKANAQD